MVSQTVQTLFSSVDTTFFIRNADWMGRKTEQTFFGPVETTFFSRNSNLIGTIILFSIFLSIIIFIRLLNKRWTSKKSSTVDQKIKKLSQKILVVTSNTIAGREIQEVVGSVTGISNVAASTDAEFRLATSEAMLDIMNKGISIGANAIIDLKLTTGSYEAQGSKWMVSKATYIGTAVRCK